MALDGPTQYLVTITAIEVAIALVIGMCIGLTAAYFGGRVDALIMRVVDLQLSFPAILVALILVAILGKGIDKVVIALVLVQCSRPSTGCTRDFGRPWMTISTRQRRSRSSRACAVRRIDCWKLDSRGMLQRNF